jgi:predicted nucleic acid-binding protein
MMGVLVDTNILIRLLHRPDPEHQLVRQAVRAIRLGGNQVFYAAQNIVEFWRARTRPVSANGFGLTIHETDRQTKIVERWFTMLPDGPAIHALWRNLVVTYSVAGVKVHDARLVAAMKVHGIADLLTLNVADFRRYPGISAIHPQQLVTSSQQGP